LALVTASIVRVFFSISSTVEEEARLVKEETELDAEEETETEAELVTAEVEFELAALLHPVKKDTSSKEYAIRTIVFFTIVTSLIIYILILAP
jgi:hypothetical protein